MGRWLHRRDRRIRFVLALLINTLLLSGANRLAAAPPTAPILLVVNDAAPNHFGRYVGEILRAEGLNAYDLIQLSALTSADLTAHRLVILAETPLTSAEASLVSTYVSGGGRLLALRPDAQLAPLFGLTPAGSSQTDGYLKIDDAQPAGKGLPTATLQIHGAADRYTLNGATAIATLYSDATTATTAPAVVTAAAGSGHTAAFMYDLAQNVAYTRQGNPANADVDTDGDGVLRTIDLFEAKGGGTPWIDRDKIAIPQADVQQRLFARLIRQLLDGVTPLPQLWYFPGTAKTMLIPTGDAHANPVNYYQKEIDSISAHGGTLTFYLSQAGDPPDGTLQIWRKQGFTFGIHPYANKPDPYPPLNITSLEQGYDVFSNWYKSAFSSPASRSVRNHQVAWKGWTDAADIAVAHGIALDTDFYHWGPWLKQSDNSWPHGYITGSGQPMKFVRADGTVLPLYQQLTELVDEQLLAAIDGAGFEHLNGAQATTVSQQMIDASLAGDYAALMTQFHVDTYGFGDPQVWAEGTLDYAKSKGVLIWNADQWLSFTETRHDAEFQNLIWDASGGQLSFNLGSASISETLSVLLPLTFGGQNLDSVSVDGTATQYTAFTVSGEQVALVGVKAGNHAFKVHYPVLQTPTEAAPASTVAPSSASASTGPSDTISITTQSGTLVIIGGIILLIGAAAVGFWIGRGRRGRQ
ncbi:MAG TPA: hypothetical protein VF909_13725 [Roseiflexaceae bacterium]